MPPPNKQKLLETILEPFLKPLDFKTAGWREGFRLQSGSERNKQHKTIL
jgi:hypothetical protein